MKRSLLAIAVVLAALTAAPAAFAHAILQESTPSNNSVVRTSPKTVSLRFNEAVETAFGSIRVYDCGGGRVDSGKILRPSKDSVAVTIDRQARQGHLHGHVAGDLGRLAPGRGRLRLQRQEGERRARASRSSAPRRPGTIDALFKFARGARLRADPARRRRRDRARGRPSLGGRGAPHPAVPDPRGPLLRARGRGRALHRAPGRRGRRLRPERGVPLGHGSLGPPDAVRPRVPLADRGRDRRRRAGADGEPVAEGSSFCRSSRSC